MRMNSVFGVQQQAVLIVGPTGAGKSPLGDHLARHGWHGRRCAHFDFGRNLRAVADGTIGGFSGDEVAFVEQSRVKPGDLLVLNGLPRHRGQAADVDRLVQIADVIQLDCTAEVVHERLRLNSGGDRDARTDDGVALVEKKLSDFAARTAPLVAHYRDRGVAIHRWAIGVRTRPEELVQA